MKYIILALFLGLIGCGNDIGNKENTGNDNSIDIIDIEPGENDDGNSPFICGDTDLPDGAGGFLWKPISESDGNLVILFPEKFTKPFGSVCIETLLGDVECGRFADFGNGNRQHWRFDLPGSEYTGVVDADGCEWVVSDPSARQD